MSAPRMIPRSVSSLMLSPARSASSRAILLPFEIVALAGRGRSGMAAYRNPSVVLPDPHVGEKHAILDRAAEIFEAPASVHGSDHHIVEGRRVLDVELDRVDVAALDRVQPVVAVHHERPGRA